MILAAGWIHRTSEVTVGKLQKYALPPVFLVLQSVKPCGLVSA